MWFNTLNFIEYVYVCPTGVIKLRSLINVNGLKFGGYFVAAKIYILFQVPVFAKFCVINNAREKND